MDGLTIYNNKRILVSQEQMHKFNTCQYRSETPEKRLVSSCCSSGMQEGYVCNKLDLFLINHVTCLRCKVYSAKSNPPV